MRGRVVLDASALLKMVLEEGDSDAFRTWYVQAVSDGVRFQAPANLYAEVGRVIQREFADLDAAAKRRLHGDLIAGLEFLDVAGEGDRDWGCAERLEFFDALYLSAAQAADGLCTFDDRMAAEASGAGVPLYGPG